LLLRLLERSILEEKAMHDREEFWKGGTMTLNVNLNDLRDTVDNLLTASEPATGSSLAILRGMITHELDAFQKTVNMALLGIIQAQSNVLTALGESWLAAGAQAYALVDENILFCYPESACKELELTRHRVKLWSALRVEGRKVGRVGIWGLEGQPFQQRLEAESSLLSLLLSLKTDLDGVRAERQSQQRMKSDMDVAANIQLQLLQQRIPRVEGLDLYARSVPALQIGGDFYNFNMHKQGSLVFAAGDVSGKGLPAAMLMAMTRIVLHGAARFMPKVNPKLLLSRINEDLYDDFTDLGMFATTFVGCYEPDSHLLTYANAGHSPVLHCPLGGPATLLEADGPAVGILPLNLCENVCMDFLPGDVLVVATDGFSEAANAQGEMYGYERLCRLLEQLAPLNAEQIASEMFHSIIQFSEGQDQSDDQTIIILKGVEA
jgi:Stage II sporulation protein E (SpoIIE)